MSNGFDEDKYADGVQPMGDLDDREMSDSNHDVYEEELEEISELESQD